MSQPKQYLTLCAHDLLTDLNFTPTRVFGLRLSSLRQPGHGFLSLVYARQRRQFIPQAAMRFVEIAVAFTGLFDAMLRTFLFGHFSYFFSENFLAKAPRSQRVDNSTFPFIAVQGTEKAISGCFVKSHRRPKRRMPSTASIFCMPTKAGKTAFQETEWIARAIHSSCMPLRYGREADNVWRATTRNRGNRGPSGCETDMVETGARPSDRTGTEARPQRQMIT